MTGAAAQGDDPSDFVTLDWRGRPLRLECRWVGDPDATPPPIVFLHEGLGSVAMWKDFPERFCRDHGFRGLVYSRYGYGRSTPKPPGERWTPSFLADQAFEVLPALLERLGIDRPWLFGHSDGGSIALLHASRFDLAGAIVVAPHVFVEAVSIESIEKARIAWETTDLRQRLARYHDDPASAFRGWNDVWLDPAFRAWTIESELESIRCPLLAVQGSDDEYGTMEQLRRIRARRPETVIVELEGCGHSPHRDRPEALAESAASFIRHHSAPERPEAPPHAR